MCNKRINLLKGRQAAGHKIKRLSINYPCRHYEMISPTSRKIKFL